MLYRCGMSERPDPPDRFYGGRNAAAGRVMQTINAAACRLVQCISEAVLTAMDGEQKKAPDCPGFRESLKKEKCLVGNGASDAPELSQGTTQASDEHGPMVNPYAEALTLQKDDGLLDRAGRRPL